VVYQWTWPGRECGSPTDALAPACSYAPSNRLQITTHFTAAYFTAYFTTSADVLTCVAKPRKKKEKDKTKTKTRTGMVLETPAGRAGTEAYAIELTKALLRVVTTLLLYFFL
jgi:hypothetical protein